MPFPQPAQRRRLLTPPWNPNAKESSPQRMLAGGDEAESPAPGLPPDWLRALIASPPNMGGDGSEPAPAARLDNHTNGNGRPRLALPPPVNVEGIPTTDSLPAQGRPPIATEGVALQTGAQGAEGYAETRPRFRFPPPPEMTANVQDEARARTEQPPAPMAAQGSQSLPRFALPPASAREPEAMLPEGMTLPPAGAAIAPHEQPPARFDLRDAINKRNFESGAVEGNAPPALAAPSVFVPPRPHDFATGTAQPGPNALPAAGEFARPRQRNLEQEVQPTGADGEGGAKGEPRRDVDPVALAQRVRQKLMESNPREQPRWRNVLQTVLAAIAEAGPGADAGQIIGRALAGFGVGLADRRSGDRLALRREQAAADQELTRTLQVEDAASQVELRRSQADWHRTGRREQQREQQRQREQSAVRQDLRLRGPLPFDPNNPADAELLRRAEAAGVTIDPARWGSTGSHIRPVTVLDDDGVTRRPALFDLRTGEIRPATGADGQPVATGYTQPVDPESGMTPAQTRAAEDRREGLRARWRSIDISERSLEQRIRAHNESMGIRYEYLDIARRREQEQQDRRLRQEVQSSISRFRQTERDYSYWNRMATEGTRQGETGEQAEQRRQNAARTRDGLQDQLNQQSEELGRNFPFLQHDERGFQTVVPPVQRQPATAAPPVPTAAPPAPAPARPAASARPQAQGGGQYAGRIIRRAALPQAAQRLGMTVEQAEAHLRAQGATIQ